MRSRPRSLPYWISSPEERCSHCGGSYAYQIEVRCTDCDAPGCPVCMTVVHQGQSYCPGCSPAKARK